MRQKILSTQQAYKQASQIQEAETRLLSRNKYWIFPTQDSPVADHYPFTSMSEHCQSYGLHRLQKPVIGGSVREVMDYTR